MRNVEGAALNLPPGWTVHPGPRRLRMTVGWYCRLRPADVGKAKDIEYAALTRRPLHAGRLREPRSRAASEAGLPVRKAHREKQRADRKMSLLIFSAALCFSLPGNAPVVFSALQRHAVGFLRLAPSAAVGSRGIIPLVGPGAKPRRSLCCPGTGLSFPRRASINGEKISLDFSVLACYSVKEIARHCVKAVK